MRGNMTVGPPHGSSRSEQLPGRQFATGAQPQNLGTRATELKSATSATHLAPIKGPCKIGSPTTFYRSRV